MAKKTKDEAPNPNGVTNRDIIQRLNFLYQASTYLNTVPKPSSPSAPSSSTPAPVLAPTTGKGKRLKRKVTAGDLAKAYVSCMKTVGQKTTVKIDPAVKRTICKGCNITLIPGSTVSVRVKKSTSHGHAIIYTCNECGTSRRIPAPPTLSSDPPAHSETTQHPKLTIPIDQMEMDIAAPSDMHEDGQKSSRTRPHRNNKGSIRPRRPPHFSRDIGHVVFRGNERLPNIEHDTGDGIYVS